MTRLRMAMDRRGRRSDEGSILPLVAAYAAIIVGVLVVAADVTSLYLEQSRLDTLADAAANAAADGFVLEIVDGTAVASLNDDEVRRQAAALVAASPVEAVLAEATAPEGRTARVTVTSVWHPPLISILVPDGVVLTSVATARTALG